MDSNLYYEHRQLINEDKYRYKYITLNYLIKLFFNNVIGNLQDWWVTTSYLSIYISITIYIIPVNECRIWPREIHCNNPRAIHCNNPVEHLIISPTWPLTNISTIQPIERRSILRLPFNCDSTNRVVLKIEI